PQQIDFVAAARLSRVSEARVVPDLETTLCGVSLACEAERVAPFPERSARPVHAVEKQRLSRFAPASSLGRRACRRRPYRWRYSCRTAAAATVRTSIGAGAPKRPIAKVPVAVKRDATPSRPRYSSPPGRRQARRPARGASRGRPPRSCDARVTRP